MHIIEVVETAYQIHAASQSRLLLDPITRALGQTGDPLAERGIDPINASCVDDTTAVQTGVRLRHCSRTPLPDIEAHCCAVFDNLHDDEARPYHRLGVSWLSLLRQRKGCPKGAGVAHLDINDQQERPTQHHALHLGDQLCNQRDILPKVDDATQPQPRNHHNVVLFDLLTAHIYRYERTFC